MNNEDFNKGYKENIAFLDSLFLLPYVYKYDEITEMMDAIKHDSCIQLLLQDRLDGCVFNYLNAEDFANYLNKRYNVNYKEELEIKYRRQKYE